MRLTATCDSNLEYRMGDRPIIRGSILDGEIAPVIVSLLWFADAALGHIQENTIIDEYNFSTGEWSFTFKAPFGQTPQKGHFSLIALTQVGSTLEITDQYQESGVNIGGQFEIPLTDDFQGIIKIDDEICEAVIETDGPVSLVTLTKRGVYDTKIVNHILDAQIKKISAIMTAIPRFNFEVKSKETD